MGPRGRACFRARHAPIARAQVRQQPLMLVRCPQLLLADQLVVRLLTHHLIVSVRRHLRARVVHVYVGGYVGVYVGGYVGVYVGGYVGGCVYVTGMGHGPPAGAHVCSRGIRALALAEAWRDVEVRSAAGASWTTFYNRPKQARAQREPRACAARARRSPHLHQRAHRAAQRRSVPHGRHVEVQRARRALALVEECINELRMDPGRAGGRVVREVGTHELRDGGGRPVELKLRQRLQPLRMAIDDPLNELRGEGSPGLYG